MWQGASEEGGVVSELRWEVVATFLHRPPADVVWSVLDGTGIPARVRGDESARLVGLALAEVVVEVPTDRAEEARELLASAEIDAEDAGDASTPG